VPRSTQPATDALPARLVSQPTNDASPDQHSRGEASGATDRQPLLARSLLGGIGHAFGVALGTGMQDLGCGLLLLLQGGWGGGGLVSSGQSLPVKLLAVGFRCGWAG
jgi:hypothetical protein